MKHIACDLEKILGKALTKQDKLLGSLTMNWHKIAGAQLSVYSCPMRITNSIDKGQKIKILHISASNSSVGLEVTYHQSTILERIAVYFGHRIIDRVRVKVLSN